MTPCDNRTAYIVLGCILAAGLAFLAYNLLVSPVLAVNEDIDQLNKASAEKSEQIAQILRDQVKLQRWRTLSLPGVENLPGKPGVPRGPQEREHALLQTQDRYLTYLIKLLDRNK